MQKGMKVIWLTVKAISVHKVIQGGGDSFPEMQDLPKVPIFFILFSR